MIKASANMLPPLPEYIYPEEGSGIFLLNIGAHLPDYLVSHATRPQHESH
jgi:hypothetical protein